MALLHLDSVQPDGIHSAVTVNIVDLLYKLGYELFPFERPATAEITHDGETLTLDFVRPNKGE